LAVKTFKQEKVGCCLLETGHAAPFTPGSKPERGPVWDRNLCVRCALCYLYCPDAAISRQDDGFFDVDMKVCTGCGICQRECWFGAISMQEVE
jgi:2-oxoacid:acceptor oxidoreductase delta subunit (pyruvate/2-ketoisovalerate family)